MSSFCCKHITIPCFGVSLIDTDDSALHRWMDPPTAKRLRSIAKLLYKVLTKGEFCSRTLQGPCEP
eukprot:4856328-Amphidinium_carterae.1